MTLQTTKTDLWMTRYPSEKATAPDWMSFHFFTEAERCPLSVSLKHSWYRTLWGRQGYPNRPNAGAFVGIVVHAAAELINKSMLASGVSSASDPRAMATLRTLGGYSQVLSTVLEYLIGKERGNPRYAQVETSMVRSLRTKIPQMREMLQQILATRTLFSDSPPQTNSAQKAANPAFQEPRFPLAIGTHFEVVLKDSELMWTGRLDVIVVSNDNCTISD
jgi:hypothetical protein